MTYLVVIGCPIKDELPLTFLNQMVTPYEHLRDLRNKLANGNHVEPYMILTDRALRGLASIRPKSLAEAEGIPGIGPVKLHAVVPRFLEAIAKWEKNGD